MRPFSLLFPFRDCRRAALCVMILLESSVLPCQQSAGGTPRAARTRPNPPDADYSARFEQNMIVGYSYESAPIPTRLVTPSYPRSNLAVMSTLHIVARLGTCRAGSEVCFSIVKSVGVPDQRCSESRDGPPKFHRHRRVSACGLVCTCNTSAPFRAFRSTGGVVRNIDKPSTSHFRATVVIYSKLH
jgi:hypothetical protein